MRLPFQFPRGCYLLSLAALALLSSLAAYADPEPLPADSMILSWVEEVSADSLYADVSSLVGFYTRHTYSDTVSNTTGIGATRRWMRSKFQQSGALAEFFPWMGYWSGNPYQCYNVNGAISGSSGGNPLIVVGAHLDSRTVSSNDITGFAPGADDDGSGTAALLELGRLLSNQAFQHSVSLSAFSGEEQGLLGSAAYAQSLWNAGTRITGMVNLDMIGHIVHPGGAVDSTTVRCFSGPPQESSSRQLARYVKWVGEAYSDGLTVTLINALDRPGRSGDHVSFYNLGYPSVRVMETAEDVAYQHGPSDVPGNMSFSYARRVTRLVLGAVGVLTVADPAPLAPSVVNGGDGESLIVSWADSLNPPVGGVVYIAVRRSTDLNWQDVVVTPDPSPYTLTGLVENQPYQISMSVGNQEGLPSPFSLETSGTPQSAMPPENFETTSTPIGVRLDWTPRPEPNILEYIVERSVPAGEFAVATVVLHPNSSWVDNSPELGQLYWYRIKSRTQHMIVGPPTEVQEGQLASHHLGIIVVDATPDGSGAPGAPDDQEVDQFYDTILEPFDVAARWDRHDSLTVGVTTSDADLALYSVVFVHMDALNASIGSDTTALRKYLQNGGSLFACGWRMSYSIEGRSGYDHGFAPGDFLFDLAGIDSIRVQPPPLMEFVGAIGTSGYPDVDFDSVRFPVWSNGLPLCDAIWTESFPPSVSEIAAFDASTGGSSAYHGRTVALRGGDPFASWILVDVPLYCMTAASATAFIQHAMGDLNAPPAGIPHSDVNINPRDFGLDPPFPNPFNSRVIIGYSLPTAGYSTLLMYDVLGRQVAVLFDEWRPTGTYQATFDGSQLSSGLYFAVLRSGGRERIRKIVLLR